MMTNLFVLKEMDCGFWRGGFKPILDVVELVIVLVVVTTCLLLDLVSGIISRELSSSSALASPSSSSSLIRIRRRWGIRGTDLNSTVDMHNLQIR